MSSSLASVLVDSLCLAVRADGWLDVTSRPGANGPQNGPQGPGLPRPAQSIVAAQGGGQ